MDGIGAALLDSIPGPRGGSSLERGLSLTEPDRTKCPSTVFRSVELWGRAGTAHGEQSSVSVLPRPARPLPPPGHLHTVFLMSDHSLRLCLPGWSLSSHHHGPPRPCSWTTSRPWYSGPHQAFPGCGPADVTSWEPWQGRC